MTLDCSTTFLLPWSQKRNWISLRGIHHSDLEILCSSRNPDLKSTCVEAVCGLGGIWTLAFANPRLPSHQHFGDSCSSKIEPSTSMFLLFCAWKSGGTTPWSFLAFGTQFLQLIRDSLFCHFLHEPLFGNGRLSNSCLLPHYQKRNTYGCMLSPPSLLCKSPNWKIATSECHV